MKSKLVPLFFVALMLVVGVSSSYAAVAVPEPTTLTMLVAGVAGLLGAGLIRGRKK